MVNTAGPISYLTVIHLQNTPNMLPHRVRKGGGRRSDLDLRKALVLVMIVLFGAYFAVIHVFFDFSPKTDDPLRLKAKGTPATENESKQPNVPATSTEPNRVVSVAPTNWEMNPDRRYVWLDVSIDDEYVGRVTMELYYDLVPKTAENFRVLTTGEQGASLSFKNSVCHRILTDFVVQCGDFTTGKGYGGHSIYGGKFDDEPNGLRLKHSKRYLLMMANSGPNTNGSQFCFMLAAAEWLNGHHVVFGEVVEGFEVVDAMEAVGVAKDGLPLTHTVRLLEGGEIL